ncbi:CHAD domain-containing protein [Kitasatospora sp. RB6PN24]|uniref:CHAD domain-containing protein n=1 Tax=Kitasatospora humi TaxID=2893891 RepID=UPI001E403625|nr:CHAD domain-containing protein [Kitasatospora humi]MCC9306596.1 CHAD domain-containing protein [Kitasatospora humi]
MTDAPMTAPAATATAGEVISRYLTEQAGNFLRALPQAVGEAGARPGALPSLNSPAGSGGTLELLRAVRRIGGALHTFGAVFEPGWAHESRAELRWLLNLLAQEPAYQRRSARLLAAVDSLSGAAPGGAGGPGMLAGHQGAPKARALLDRQLTLARTRAHSTVLQELRSARLHALADRMTLLVGEAPLVESARGKAGEVLPPQAGAAFTALGAAVRALPLHRAATAYQGDALHRLGGAEPTGPALVPAQGRPADADSALAADDAPWHRVRILVKRARYALEVCGRPGDQLMEVDRVLDRHQDAADAAVTAATAARTPRITPATAYVLGVVHADQRLEVEAARFAFGSRWPELPLSPDGWDGPPGQRMG